MENSELITKALNYIKSETAKSEITIDDVASHAGFSTDYFNRIFFAHTGFNIMEYIRFSRLKKGARLLRLTDKDILDIALDCGYEAHESFSRAFKSQYGISPSEYRKKYEKEEPLYGDFYNDTVGARLLHEFKDFKIANSDEVIDHLLEYDSLKYGYASVCFRVNGGVALYNGDDFRDGFIWFTEWDGRFEGDIICEDFSKIAKYLKIFSDDRFDMIIYTLKDDEYIKSSLQKEGVFVSDISRRCFNAYTDAPYMLRAPEGVSMRLLTYSDFELIEKYFERKHSGSSRVIHLKHELYQRDILGNSDHSVFMFGIFKNGHLIGISDGALQRTHGLVINNCIVTSLLAEHESEELYKYAFKFVTNAALENGALPVDDTQTPNTPIENKSGAFNSEELGYKASVFACLIK
ncbi:MAG: helix-turn-helix transcriptional regulator [Clostridia bacterium]|nr:helix-turn-helix transcriptional regulator [Clostridia bacterium]